MASTVLRSSMSSMERATLFATDEMVLFTGLTAGRHVYRSRRSATSLPCS
jgi:hypothetical protein